MPGKTGCILKWNKKVGLFFMSGYKILLYLTQYKLIYMNSDSSKTRNRKYNELGLSDLGG